MGEVRLLGKNDFIKIFGKDLENIDKLYSSYSTAYKSGRTIITNDFYPVSVVNLLERSSSRIGLNILGYGFSDDAERCLIAFSEEVCDVSVFDGAAKILRISYNDKFNKLSHRDFLGSIMSLGFTREKMGDLVVEGNCVYIPIVIDFVDYVIQNLVKVRNVPVQVGLELFTRLPQKNFEILYKVVASLRIDVIVSALTNLSREKAKSLVYGSKVKLNGNLELDADTNVCENDIIVISGYGKFKIRERLGNTAKNKIKIVIDKFI